jgi:hypothetical protein
MQRKRALLSLIISLCILTSGCAAVVAAGAAGGAGIVYYQGWLTDQVTTDVPRTFEASRAGLKELNIRITEARYDNIKGKVNGELADGTNVYVKLKATEGKTTEIKIRVGALGDKDASHRILRAIKRQL